MRKFYLFAAAAVLLTACVKTQNLDEVATIGTDESAVSFDVYTARATKAGKPQEITTDILKNGPGFGVFAYYTDNSKYDQYVKPNFMYNQQVRWNKTPEVWAYEPVKYWPNETGDAAVSDDKDYVTFFAYAPYVKAEPSTGAVIHPDNLPTGVEWKEEVEQHRNITGLINNSTTGDPKIKYIVDWNPATSVDLLWGVQSSGEEIGMPFLNQLKPKTAGKTSFSLKHALAKLNVQIDAVVDAVTPAASGQLAVGTKIYVRSITFEGFAAKGTLNLNNTAKDTPLWIDYAGIDALVAEPVTIYDGRKDGKEGYLDGESAREKVLGLNPVIVQSVPYGNANETAGVTNKAVNLFVPIAPTADPVKATDPIFVIPNGDPMKVTIVYDVETKDEKLAGYLSDGVTHGSTIENTITKAIKVSNASDVANVVMNAGRAYTITLHLGMTSVKVEASVNEWTSGNNVAVDTPANS